MRKKINKLLKNLIHGTSYEEVLSGLMDFLWHNLSLKEFVIATAVNGNFSIKISRGISETFKKKFSLSINDDGFAEIFKNKTPLYIDSNLVTEQNALKIYFFPMVLKGDVVGFSYIGRDTEFTESEMEIFEDMSVLAAFILRTMFLEDRLISTTVVDELTGAYNSHYFYVKLHEALERIDRYGEKFSVMRLRYCFFDELKKKYGLEKMEESFKEIVALLERNVRNIDTVFRFHANEFVVIFENPNDENVLDLAERIKNELVILANKLGIEADFAIALAFIKEKKDTETIINTLEDAIYEAERRKSIVRID